MDLRNVEVSTGSLHKFTFTLTLNDPKYFSLRAPLVLVFYVLPTASALHFNPLLRTLLFPLVAAFETDLIREYTQKIKKATLTPDYPQPSPSPLFSQRSFASTQHGKQSRQACSGKAVVASARIGGKMSGIFFWLWNGRCSIFFYLFCHG